MLFDQKTWHRFFAKTFSDQEGDVDRAGAVQEGECPEHGCHAGQRRFGTNLINLFSDK